jgi:alpha-beta hydrolase superfamily lysophospholipase
MARLTRITLIVFASLLVAASPGTPLPPSVPGVDAPQLAPLGPHKVGFRSITLVHKGQPDLLNPDPATGSVKLYDRTLIVDIWYPAKARRGAVPVTYSGSLYGEPPHPPASFTVPGLAIRGAAPAGQGYPLVIFSHGYSNSPAVMTWLTENLASKGYVVAAIHHEDPDPYVVSAEKRSVPNYNRPVDITFVAAALRRDLGALIDPAELALIGYSQGGYGVLAAGGATLDPDGPNMGLVPGGWMKRLARGAATETEGKVPGVKAIVAIAPAGGGPRSSWGSTGMLGITAPLLLIQGDVDRTVDYQSGALADFENARNSNRFLLTFHLGGHDIGLSPPPAQMRSNLWDIDWFQDPVWRADRANAINLHFITAFLGANLKHDGGMNSFLDVAVEAAGDGVWNAPAGTAWDAYSPGGNGITLWKGFQRGHAQGLTLRHAAAGR